MNYLNIDFAQGNVTAVMPFKTGFQPTFCSADLQDLAISAQAFTELRLICTHAMKASYALGFEGIHLRTAIQQFISRCEERNLTAKNSYHCEELRSIVRQEVRRCLA